MSDMKCPICGEMLQKYGEVDTDTGTCIVLGANCPKCGIGDSDIKLWQEFIRTRKALDYAIDVIKTVAKMSDKMSMKYGETLVEQLDNIQAYCWQEGYVLTHEEDLERVITALEQKER